VLFGCSTYPEGLVDFLARITAFAFLRRCT